MMHRFYAPPERITGNSVTLDAVEARHLREVLRLKPGEAVSVFDGRGNEYFCEILTVSNALRR